MKLRPRHIREWKRCRRWVFDRFTGKHKWTNTVAVAVHKVRGYDDYVKLRWQVWRKVERDMREGLHFSIDGVEFKTMKGEYNHTFVSWEPFHLYEHYSHLPLGTYKKLN